MLRRMRTAFKILWLASVGASLVLLLLTFSDSDLRVRLASSTSSSSSYGRNLALRDRPNNTATETEDEDDDGKIEREGVNEDPFIPGDGEEEERVGERGGREEEEEGEKYQEQEPEQEEKVDGGAAAITSLRTTDELTASGYAFLSERFAERKARVRRVCQKYRNPVYSKQLTRNSFMYYSKKYNLMVCIAAKVGSSTWKSHLLHMRGIRPVTSNIHAKYFESKIKAKLLLGTYWTIQAMRNSTKVMTVRHPLERLVSAFRDKFLDGRPVQQAQSDGHMRYFWKPAMVALKKGRNEEGKLQITFHEFLQYVVKEQRSSAGDPHWMRFYRLCSVCGIDFPFVMKLETYAEDLAFLVQNLGIAEVNPLERRHSLYSDSPQTQSRPNDASTRLAIDSGEPVTPIKNSTLEYYLDVPPYLLASVLDIYKVDIEMFHYEVPPVLQGIVDRYRNGTT